MNELLSSSTNPKIKKSHINQNYHGPVNIKVTTAPPVNNQLMMLNYTCNINPLA